MASFDPNVDSSNSETMRKSNHKKRRKIGDHAANHNSLNLLPWRSKEEQIYAYRLVEALRRIPLSAAKPLTTSQVGDTADRLLAATAKGGMRWSRAILAQAKKLQTQHKKVKMDSTERLKRTGIDGERRRQLPAAQEKACVLRRLVPGCRKLSSQNLLEEAVDYIFALEMQLRAMTSIAELLPGGITCSISTGISDKDIGRTSSSQDDDESLFERVDNEMQNHGHDKKFLDKEKISDLTCYWPLSEGSSNEDNDTTSSSSEYYSGPS